MGYIIGIITFCLNFNTKLSNRIDTVCLTSLKVSMISVCIHERKKKKYWEITTICWMVWKKGLLIFGEKLQRKIELTMLLPTKYVALSCGRRWLLDNEEREKC